MLHSQIGLGDIHIPFNWVYADANARTTATGFVAGDQYKLAFQQSDSTTWALSAISPITWVEWGKQGVQGIPGVAGSGSGTASTGYIKTVANGPAAEVRATIASNDIQSLPLLGRLVSVGVGTTTADCIHTSDDAGTTWTARTSAGATQFKAIAEFNGLLIAVGLNTCETSTDGITWTSRTIPAGDYVAIAASSNLVVAVTSTTVSAYSASGTTFLSGGTINTERAHKSLAVNLATGTFATVGGATPVIQTTTDGVTWTTQSHPVMSTINSPAFISCGSSIFLVATDATSGAVSIDDGVTWTAKGTYATTLGYNTDYNVWYTSVALSASPYGPWESISDRLTYVYGETLWIDSATGTLIVANGTNISSINPSSGLAKSKTNQALAHYLSVGESVTRDFVSVYDLALNVTVATNELYRVDLILDDVTGDPARLLLLKPNDTLYTNAFDGGMIQHNLSVPSGSAVGFGISTLFNGFLLTNTSSDISTFTVSTRTTKKRVIGIEHSRTGATNILRVNYRRWNDTTTPWTSLGTISTEASGVALTGFVTITRIA